MKENFRGVGARLSRRSLAAASEFALIATALTSCSPAVVGPVFQDGGPVGPTVTETLPTPTALPAETVTPTPLPTNTPEPTRIPKRGIDIPLDLNGARITFIENSAKDNLTYYYAPLDTTWYSFGDYEWISFRINFSGDLRQAFAKDGPLTQGGKLYIEGRTYKKYKSFSLIYLTGLTREFVFAVRYGEFRDKGPIILHDDYDHWEFDLAQIMQTGTATPTASPPPTDIDTNP